MLKTLVRISDRRVTKGRLFLLWNGVFGKRYRKIQQMSQNPILIGGCGRSGTSLLLSLLSVLPNVYCILDETKAFLPKRRDVDYLNSFAIDFVYDRLIKDELSLENFGRWCEKTPRNIHVAECALDYLGSGARFVHIVRDGRDVVTSQHPSKSKPYHVPPERWVRAVRDGRAVESHPQVLTVRYEDLTANPMSEMRRICDFLDEPFEEERFRAYPESAQFGTGDFFRNAVPEDRKSEVEENEQVHERSVERWKEEEHASVVNQLLSLDGATELLRHYGYLKESSDKS